MARINRLNDGVRTDRFEVIAFDHLEFYATDAKSCMKALKVGLGLRIVAQSLHETGNHIYASYVLATGNIRWYVTAPYLSDFQHPKQECPHPNFKAEAVRDWVGRHGNGVGAIGVKVSDAALAYATATGPGADGGEGTKGVTPPTELKKDGVKGSVVLAEVLLYGDTILRFVQYKDGYDAPYLPGYAPVEDKQPLDYGLVRMDHVVGNVYDMNATCDQIKRWLGFHTFAAFTKECSRQDIQTEWTSLNSEVLSNDYSTVLLPINEPAKKKRESQITEYLKAYNGPGVQHLALFTPDVLTTIGKIRDVSYAGGFEFIPTPAEYYNDEKVKKMMDQHLTPDAQKLAKEYGLLIDEDDEGVLLQIFTKPLFDRPTIFVEVIQRLCHGEVVDRPGCGGFGKGNFRALFQSIERLQAQRDMLLPEDDAAPAPYQ